MSNQRTGQPLNDRRREEDDEDRGFFFWLFRARPGVITRGEAVTIAAVFGIIIGLILLTRTIPEEKVAAPAPAAAPALEIAPAPAQVAETKVETQQWGSSVIFPIEGRDSARKRAAFDVAVLPTDLAWARKSSTAVTQGDTEIPESETVDRVFTPELRAGLAQSSQVIAVGLASQEGQVEEETERARARAATAAGWLAAAVPREKGVWTLNLGQFKGTCKAQVEGATGTSWQRPLIIVGIREQEEGVNLIEAFGDAISGKSNLPSRDCYTNFDLTLFR